MHAYIARNRNFSVGEPVDHAYNAIIHIGMDAYNGDSL